jgi:hypothetical protein
MFYILSLSTDFISSVPILLKYFVSVIPASTSKENRVTEYELFIPLFTLSYNIVL